MSAECARPDDDDKRKEHKGRFGISRTESDPQRLESSGCVKSDSHGKNAILEMQEDLRRLSSKIRGRRLSNLSERDFERVQSDKKLTGSSENITNEEHGLGTSKVSERKRKEKQSKPHDHSSPERGGRERLDSDVIAARELQAHLDSLLKSGLVKTGSSEALNKLLEECKQGVQMLSFGGLRRSNSEENLGQNDSESESSDAEGVFASGGLLRKVCSEDNLCAMHRSRVMSVVQFVTRTWLLSLHCAFAYCRSEAYSHSKIAREQKST